MFVVRGIVFRDIRHAMKQGGGDAIMIIKVSWNSGYLII